MPQRQPNVRCQARGRTVSVADATPPCGIVEGPRVPHRTEFALAMIFPHTASGNEREVGTCRS